MKDTYEAEPFELYPELDEFETLDMEWNGDSWESEVNRSSRDYTRWIQYSLNRILGLGLAVDGIFGTQTRNAIRSFQKQRGLIVDGVVGQQTEAALIAARSGQPPGSSTQRTLPRLTSAVVPGHEYGPNWRSRRPPGLPASARQASARGAAVDAVRAAARRQGLGEVFVTLVSHLAETESGAAYARPANNFDARPPGERPAGKALITAWGVFQFNRDAWRSLPDTSPTSFPWDASATEEIERPIGRYAELFRQVRMAGGTELAAARGVRLWHRSPAAFRSYVRNGQSSGFDAAWRAVPQRHLAVVDQRMEQIGLPAGGHHRELSQLSDEFWPVALDLELEHSDEETSTSMIILSDSVGSGGANKQHDVFPIQSLLNKFISAGKLPGISPLAPDGKMGSRTIAAIRAFQKRIVGMTSPDGRVDPGGLTLQALNGPVAQPLVSPSPAVPPLFGGALQYGVPGGRISAKTHQFLGRRKGNRIHFGIDVSPSGAAGGGAGDPRRGLEVFFTPKAKIRVSDLKSAPAAMKREGPLENRIALDGVGDAWLQGAKVTRAFTHKEPDNSYGGWVAIACQYGYVKSSGGSGVFTILIEYLHLITSDALPYPGQGNRISLSEWQKAGKGHRIGLGPYIRKGATFSASDALGSPPILIGFFGATRWPHVHIQAAFNPPGSTNFPRIDPAAVLT